MLSKIINIILALLFVSFVAVQFDDPDPVLWILIYANMVMICAWAAFRTPNPYWIWINAAGYFIYAIILFPGAIDWFKSPDRSLLFDDLAKMQYPYIEETREFLGLVISLVVLAWQVWRKK
ncbi:MAG: transmembrane 220 family protein [Cyclobacteriaceae bacterium]|nr:transmembrane 220 family protein [Cyclobacteriaceae bacterium]